MTTTLWKDVKIGKRCQFVADVLEESLFDYAFDSDKVPSLNLHFFCNDFYVTYANTKEGILKEGNLNPLSEEFEYLLKSSPWLPDEVSDSLLNFKNQYGYYFSVDKEKNMSEKNKAEYYIESAKYISSILSSDDNYLFQLVREIDQILKGATFELREHSRIYHCVREFISELINYGVSKTYLYDQVCTKLFSGKAPEDDIQYLIAFLRSLFPQRKEYDVIIGVSDEAYKELKHSVSIMRKSNEYEKSRLNANYVAKNTFPEIDPVSALTEAKQGLCSLMNVYNACKHDTSIYVLPNGLVKLNTEKRFKLINDSRNLLAKDRMLPKQERDAWLKTVVHRPLKGILLSAFDLHNAALSSNDPKTQLLNLWMILEVMIESKQDNLNRINYISNVLSAILCNVYFERRIFHLYNTICSIKGVKELVESEKQSSVAEQKLAIILMENSSIMGSIEALLENNPLLIYKMDVLANLFSSRKKMKEELERHGKRLRWHLMRIYRNRCMIVHDGTAMPYLNNLVENLHYYVDELFNLVLRRREKGILDIEAIIASSRLAEHKHLALLDENSSMNIDSLLHIIYDN